MYVKWLPVCGSSLSFRCKKQYYTRAQSSNLGSRLPGKCERPAVGLAGSCICEVVSFLITEWRNHCCIRRMCSLQQSNAFSLSFFITLIHNEPGKKCLEQTPLAGELGVKISVERRDSWSLSQERSLIHGFWRVSKWKTTHSCKLLCSAGLLAPLRCLPFTYWSIPTTQQYGKFFLDSQCILIPIMSHFLSLLTMSRVVSRIRSLRLCIWIPPDLLLCPACTEQNKILFSYKLAPLFEVYCFCITLCDLHWFCLCSS